MDRSARGIPEQPLRVAAVQMESVPGDKDANLATVEAFVARAAQAGVQLIAFPECCVTGYWFLRNLTASHLQQKKKSWGRHCLPQTPAEWISRSA